MRQETPSRKSTHLTYTTGNDIDIGHRQLSSQAVRTLTMSPMPDTGAVELQLNGRIDSSANEDTSEKKYQSNYVSRANALPHYHLHVF